MKFFKLTFVLGLLLAIVGSVSSCSDSISQDEPDVPEISHVETTAPCFNEGVSVKVFNYDGAFSRASSSFLEENIDRFTATRVDTKSSKYTVVSYHGRNEEQIGMVQLVKTDGTVLSELVFEDARVNFAQLREHSSGDVIYVAVDKEGPMGKLCGILPVRVVNSHIILENEVVYPYFVDGVSLNCIKQHNGDTQKAGVFTMVAAAGGNVKLGTEYPAGFTKFQIDSQDPTRLGILSKSTYPNFRGYWFSFGYINGAPAAWTYRTIEDGKLSYKVSAMSYANALDMFSNTINTRFLESYPVATATVWQSDELVDKGRYCVIAIMKQPGYKFIIVSTGSKEGGIVVYRYNQSANTLTEVDRWHKAAACLGTEVYLDGDMYIFAGCGDGVYKIKVNFDVSNPDAAVAYLEPVKKHKVTDLTESGTLASTNYIQVKGSGRSAKIHVAGGYAGYYILDVMTGFESDVDGR